MAGPIIDCPGNTTFRCHNGACVNASYVCDGTDTCGDGSDESADVCAGVVLLLLHVWV